MTNEELFDWCCKQNCKGDFNCDLCMYNKGKADMLDSIIQAEKNKYYCDEELCGESKDCSDCMVRYLEQLKKGQK